MQRAAGAPRGKTRPRNTLGERPFMKKFFDAERPPPCRRSCVGGARDQNAPGGGVRLEQRPRGFRGADRGPSHNHSLGNRYTFRGCSGTRRKSNRAFSTPAPRPAPSRSLGPPVSTTKVFDITSGEGRSNWKQFRRVVDSPPSGQHHLRSARKSGPRSAAATMPPQENPDSPPETLLGSSVGNAT